MPQIRDFEVRALLITKKGHHIKLIRKDEKRAYVQELGQRKILDCSLTMEVTEMAARTYMTKYLKKRRQKKTLKFICTQCNKKFRSDRDVLCPVCPRCKTNKTKLYST